MNVSFDPLPNAQRLAYVRCLGCGAVNDAIIQSQSPQSGEWSPDLGRTLAACGWASDRFCSAHCQKKHEYTDLRGYNTPAAPVTMMPDKAYQASRAAVAHVPQPRNAKR